VVFVCGLRPRRHRKRIIFGAHREGVEFQNSFNKLFTVFNTFIRSTLDRRTLEIFDRNFETLSPKSTLADFEIFPDTDIVPITRIPSLQPIPFRRLNSPILRCILDLVHRPPQNPPSPYNQHYNQPPSPSVPVTMSVPAVIPMPVSRRSKRSPIRSRSNLENFDVYFADLDFGVHRAGY